MKPLRLHRGRAPSILGALGAALLGGIGLVGLLAARPGAVLASLVGWVGMSWQTIASSLALLAGVCVALFTRLHGVNLRLERVVAERTQALAANEAKFRGIFNHAVEGIYQSTPGGRSLSVNPEMARICGYASPEEMIGSVNDLDTQFYLRPGRRREVNERLAREGALLGVESEIRRKDGSPLWVSENVRLVREPGTGETIYLGSIVDITERREAREATRRALEAAETADRAKSAFLANMSHELRTPLNGILGFARLLGRDPATDAHARERLAIIESSGEHLLSLINEVLDYSKIEAGKVELHSGPCHLPGLLMSLADDFSRRCADRGLRFRAASATADLPRMVRVDEGKLRQVLLNLLGNAVKFTERGEVSLLVERVEASQPPALRFAVTDTGVGIARERHGEIFLPFHQAADPARASQGTGLGLSISRRLVGLMGGELRVESTPGAGSRFWFELTLPWITGEDAATQGAKSRLEPARVTGHQGRPRHVLVVDDDATNRRLARELLAEAGLEVTEVESGEQCLERFAVGVSGDQPDLVLLDLRMGPPDGLETARRLRASGAGHPGLKILASSAGDTEPSRVVALAAGCDDFVPKPLQAKILLDAVGHLLALEWTYSDPPTPPGGPSENVETAPSDADLDALLDLAGQGDLLGLRAALTRLGERQPDYADFVRRMDGLTASFQVGKLREELRRVRNPAVP